MSLSATSIENPFRVVWTISGQQKGLLTCVAVSPGALWLVCGSQDATLLFVDFKTGVAIGTLDFESRFYVTSAVWRTDSIIVAGCSNGVLYHIEYDHKSQKPLSMRSLLDTMPSPIRTLAVDTFRGRLAIGCGGDVYIYACSNAGATEKWARIDHVLAPCSGPHGLVTGLCFFGSSLGGLRLFIGHAMAGWNIWTGPHSYRRTPSSLSGQVCSIGSATVSSDGLTIAISTLEQSIVTYLLQDDGPISTSKVEFGYKEKTDYRPIVLIALTANNLVMKGTTSGDVPILDCQSGNTTSLHQGPHQMIRTLTTHGDKVLVGSSDLSHYRLVRWDVFAEIPAPI
ncbi:hypothetical protein BDV93DRAFT_565699 [Ceratobasidium sp. AG-I]|nr:hypothetical protein BDV93DRAFT_565699 [Ceratobasidium sp. AG-I]